MSSTLIAMLLATSVMISSVRTIQSDDLKNLKLSETLNKYVSSQLYVFAGKDKEGKPLFSASQFNSSTEEWDNATDMAVARDNFCGAVVGTRIYLFGGYTDKRMKTAEVYDCETGTYSQFRSMPSPRTGCGAAVLGDFIYVAGGHDDSGESSSVIRYNIHTTRREAVSSMHTARDGLQLIQLGGRLYAIGGTTNTVETYTPTSDRWFPVASTHYQHQIFGAAVHEGKIYVCSDKGFEVYYPDTNEWETLTPINNYEGRSLVSMNGKLLALGGGNPATKSVFTFNTSTRKWSTHPDMDFERSHHTSFVVNH